MGIDDFRGNMPATPAGNFSRRFQMKGDLVNSDTYSSKGGILGVVRYVLSIIDVIINSGGYRLVFFCVPIN